MKNGKHHAVDSGFQVLDSGFFVRLNLYFLHKWYSGFQSPGFRIQQANTSWILEITPLRYLPRLILVILLRQSTVHSMSLDTLKASKY